MKYFNFDVSEWLASRRAVSFCLLIGVFFLVSNYQNILYRVNPDHAQAFVYPFLVQVLLAHLDSLFFGLTTAILLFQSRYEWQKILYCCLEAIMVFLNLNRNFIQDLGFESNYILGAYVAVFSGFSLYFLGSLAKAHKIKKQAIELPINGKKLHTHSTISN